MRIHLAVLALASSLHAQEPRGFDVDSLAPGVYAFVRREPVAYGMESNSLLVIGARYAAVVDAQLTLTDTREVIAAVRRITSLPVRYVVNTHCHDDHVTGNPAYAEAFPGVDFVASREMAAELDDICARNRASFRRSGSSTPNFLRDLVAKGESLIGGPIADDERLAHLSYARLIEQFAAEASERAVAPTIVFDDSTSLDLGGRRIDVLHLGRGHSRGDAIVLVPDARVIAAGDLVVWPVPFVGTTSFPGDFARTLEKLMALDARVILPGHGPVLRDAAYVHDVARMLAFIRDRVAQSIARGDSLSATRQFVDMSEFRARFGGESKLRLGLFDNYVKASAIPAEFNVQAARRP